MIFGILNFSLSTAHWLAMAPPASQPGDPPNKGLVVMLGQIVLIVVVFYLILVRPQQKQQKELKKMLEALKSGDRVLTTSGMFGVVNQVKEKTVIVKISENTKVEMLRSGIQQVLPNEEKT